jgi:PAS domain S-box-containing protein
MRDIVQRHAQGEEKPLHVELRLRCKDGGYRWFLSRGIGLRDARGDVERIVGSISDIEDRKRLDEVTHRLAAIVESSHDAIVGKDLRGIVTAWNKGAEAMFGYTAAEMVGSPIAKLIPDPGPSGLAEVEGILARVSRGEHISNYETVRRHKDGRLLNVSLSVSPILDRHGHVIGASKIARDVTERKRTQAALAEAAVRKDIFLATLAHELRNPLAPIRNGLQILRMPCEPGQAQRVSEMMDRQLSHLVRLVDDLLDISRISSGKVTLQRKRVTAGAVARSAVEGCQGLMEAASHALTVDIPDERLELDVDPTRIDQVIHNLLANAAKYTPPGGHIKLGIVREQSDVVIRVVDDGLGIPAHMLLEVFEMFTQVNHTLHRSQGGLGIGLALVQKLVELHGGTVSAASEGTRMGSTFTVRLPYVPPAAPALAAQSEEVVAGGTPLRVLVVDDNVDAAQTLAILLELSAHEVKMAHDGTSGVAAALAFVPDLVLLDIGLPDMDGYAVARRLRGEASLSRVRLAALTGWGSADDKRKAEEAGFNHHLTKPVEVAELMKVISIVQASVATDREATR